MLSLGTTFLIPTPPTFDPDKKHLHILIAVEQSTDRGLMVNFTTVKDRSDKSCVVMTGEHPFLKHQSVVNYADSKIVSLLALENGLSKRVITPHEPVSPELLKKIRDCGLKSPAIPIKNRDFLLAN
jgi:hypothetical protein